LHHPLFLVVIHCDPGESGEITLVDGDVCAQVSEEFDPGGEVLKCDCRIVDDHGEHDESAVIVVNHPSAGAVHLLESVQEQEPNPHL